MDLLLEVYDIRSTLNPLENLVGLIWRVDSCVDVREHSWTSVTTDPLFALFCLLSRLSLVLVSGSLPLSTDALMTPTYLHHLHALCLMHANVYICPNIQLHFHFDYF